MALSGTVLSGDGTGNEATVSSRGQLIVAPLDFSDPVAHDIGCACVGVNFFTALPSHQFVVTDIFVHTDRAVPAAGIVAEIYESCSATSLTTVKCMFKIDLPRQSGVGHSGLNFLVTEGRWLNAKISVSSGVTSITIEGYYIQA